MATLGTLGFFKLSQDLLEGFSWKRSIDIFHPRRVNQSDWRSFLFREVDIYCFERTVLTTRGWIALKTWYGTFLSSPIVASQTRNFWYVQCFSFFSEACLFFGCAADRYMGCLSSVAYKIDFWPRRLIALTSSNRRSWHIHLDWNHEVYITLVRIFFMGWAFLGGGTSSELRFCWFLFPPEYFQNHSASKCSVFLSDRFPSSAKAFFISLSNAGLWPCSGKLLFCLSICLQKLVSYRLTVVRCRVLNLSVFVHVWSDWLLPVCGEDGLTPH